MVPTKREDWKTVLILGSGPSLSKSILYLSLLKDDVKVIAINDTYKLYPNADILYACDDKWWKHHQGVMGFKGEKFSCFENRKVKDLILKEYNVQIVDGTDSKGFGKDKIHYGKNSGFQAVNLAILLGAEKIILLGFDMKLDRGKSHFFGEHPFGFAVSPYHSFIEIFNKAIDTVPEGVKIYNATEDSALKCFETINIQDIGILKDDNKT